MYFSPPGSILGINLGGLPPDPETWYRDDWTDANNVNDCKASFIAQSRYDRYEVYSPLMRLWTTALDTEQVVFTLQTNPDKTGTTWSPNYKFIGGRVLLAAGACDDYDNATGNFSFLQSSSTPSSSPANQLGSGLLPPGIPTVSMGVCNGNPIGNTGANAITHIDIYGYTHDMANDMRNASGKTLFLNDTGHSIHDERPIFFAAQIIDFLNQKADNNIDITLRTNDEDVRWNSEVHVMAAAVQMPIASPPVEMWGLEVPLNYWFHPWPSDPGKGPLLQPLGSPDNPCGAAFGKIPTLNCTKLSTFDLENNSTHTFTIALPSGIDPATMNVFALNFISGWNITAPGDIGYGNDKWDLGAIAACLSGSTGAFVSDGFNAKPGTTLKTIQANNYGWPGLVWTPPSFAGTASIPSAPGCASIPAGPNPPPNGAASRFF